MTRLSMQDCWDNRWVMSAGKWWALRGSSSTRLKICMRDLPNLKCPGGECKEVRFDTPVTFSSGHIVNAISRGGSGHTSYGDISVSPPTSLPSISDMPSTVPSVIGPAGDVIPIEILIPDKLGGYTSFVYNVVIPSTSSDVPDVISDIPVITPDIPVVVPSVSKTINMIELPASVFKDDTRTMVGIVSADGAWISDEPVVMKLDGVVIGDTITSVGMFSFVYQFDKAGTHKLTFESPSTSQYPDFGRSVHHVSVSSVTPGLTERLRVEQEEYAARRRALEKARIKIPEYRYDPIFHRHDELFPALPIDMPVITPIDEIIDEPTIPTRGSIFVELPTTVGVMPGTNLIKKLQIAVPVSVWLNDKFSGNAPIVINNVKVGAHTVVMKAAGYEPYTTSFNVQENSISNVTGITMIPLWE